MLVMVMCLIISLQIDKLSGAEVESIAALHEGVFALPGKNWRRKLTGIVTLSIDRPGSCACSMLSDDAAWGVNYWDFLPESLMALAVTIETIGRICRRAMNFEAIWIGDRHTETVALTLPDMLEIIRQNRIGEKTRYLISAVDD